jgi:hypothetical protein
MTIEAVTPERARLLRAALAGFRTQVIQSEDGRQSIRVELGRGEREIIDLLNALELYVTQQGDGPARINLDGHDFTLHGNPPEADGSD